MVSELFYVYMVFMALLFGVFLVGFLLHVFVILMDGKKGVKETLKTTMFAATPGLLLGWIPFVCIIGWVWSFVLLILGFRDNNGLSFEKAVLVVSNSGCPGTDYARTGHQRGLNIPWRARLAITKAVLRLNLSYLLFF